LACNGLEKPTFMVEFERFKVRISTWKFKSSIRRPNSSIPDHRHSDSTDRPTLILSSLVVRVKYDLFCSNLKPSMWIRRVIVSTKFSLKFEAVVLKKWHLVSSFLQRNQFKKNTHVKIQLYKIFLNRSV
jgi:hypothetical protein